MIAEKLYPSIVAAFMVFAFSTNAFAEFFSISGGIPVTQAFTGDDIDLEPDGMPYGAIVHVKFPIMVGVGYETYAINIKDVNGTTDIIVFTEMIDVFYLFPIPVINVTLGLGTGRVEMDCKNSAGTSCSDLYHDALATQWWVQLGFPVFPSLDVHASYHSVSAIAEGINSASNIDLSGTTMALGVSFIF